MIIFLISTSYLTIYQLAHYYCTELKSGETTKWPHLQYLLSLVFSNNRFIVLIFSLMNKTLYVNFESNAKEIYVNTVFKYRSKAVSHSRSKFW